MSSSGSLRGRPTSARSEILATLARIASSEWIAPGSEVVLYSDMIENSDLLNGYRLNALAPAQLERRSQMLAGLELEVVMLVREDPKLQNTLEGTFWRVALRLAGGRPLPFRRI
jgi:hypothetical protein